MPAPELAPVTVAVIGAGGWGRNHVRNFASLEGVELRYVCDRSVQARSRLARAHRAATFVADASRVLEDGSLQAVVVATDAPSHHEIAKRALLEGKDVFVEKPLTLDSETSDELCELAEARQRILMVGHLLLYHPAVERLKRLLDDGELGDILYIYSQRTNLGVVRQNENAWWSLAPHDIAVANYLIGDEPASVSVAGGTFLQKDHGIEDVAFATLRYAQGRLAHLHVSWLDPHKMRRLTVVGSKRMAVFDDTSADQKLALFDKGAEAPDDALPYAAGVRLRTGDIRIPALQMVEPLLYECQAFVEAVRTRSKPRSDGRSGLSVVRVLEAGSRSLAEAGRSVSVG